MIQCIILLFTILLTQAREEDKRDKFLYTSEYCPDPCPVKDYHLAKSLSVEAEEDEEEEEDTVEAKRSKPYFMLASNGPRAVEFYSPWCGHCQSFRTRFIQLAREVNDRKSTTSQKVDFHAVSCSVYHYICQENGVTGYPTILAFKSGATSGVKLDRITVESIAEGAGIILDGAKPGEDRGEESDTPDGNAVDILGASRDAYQRLKKDTFSDASLSFTYALKTNVFKENAVSSLSPQEKHAFVEWIDLLYWTLPPTWRLHTLINDLRGNMDHVLENRQGLVHMVDKHNEVVIEQKEWSAGCTHGKEIHGVGYTCGLWNLLHILSVGVAERQQAVLGLRDRVSVKYAADTLRNYFDFFLGCEICRENFIDVYDNCGMNNCKRFSPRKTAEKSWKELALWLWEYHNHVNIRLLRERYEKQGVEITLEDQEGVMWPSRERCRDCWLKDGKWDTERVYAHLKSEYWPGGVQNFRYVVLDRKSKESNDTKLTWFQIFLRIVGASIAMGFLVTSMKKMRLFLTGRHKKFESDYV